MIVWCVPHDDHRAISLSIGQPILVKYIVEISTVYIHSWLNRPPKRNICFTSLFIYFYFPFFLVAGSHKRGITYNESVHT